jgi:hypothetical protein
VNLVSELESALRRKESEKASRNFWEERMKMAATLLALTIIALAMSVVFSFGTTPRESAMHRCNAQTLRQVPKGGPNFEHRRAFVWKGCMAAHGQRP